MHNPIRKFIAATAASTVMFGGAVAFGAGSFAVDPTTTTAPSTSTSSTVAPTTTAPPTTVPSPPTTFLVPMTLDPVIVAAGGTTHLSLPNIAKSTSVKIGLVKGDPKNPDVIPLAVAKTDANGLLDVTLTIPADTPPGTYAVVVHPDGSELVYAKAIEVTAAAQTPAAKPVPATPTYTG